LRRNHLPEQPLHLKKQENYLTKIMGYPFEGKWFDVSTPEIYERALKEW